jgi:phosphoribosylglycinamide formyltransferase 1
MSPRLAVLCSGGGSNFEAIQAAILHGVLRAEIAVMICDKPKAFAIKRAARLGVPAAVIPSNLFASRRDHEKLVHSILKALSVDAIVLAGYMRLFTPWFVNAWKGRMLNVHPSLLPAFKGAHAIRDAYHAGVKTTGVSVHVVTPELDAGPVIARVKVGRTSKDTLASLEAKIHKAEHRLYPAAIARYLKTL